MSIRNRLTVICAMIALYVVMTGQAAAQFGGPFGGNRAGGAKFRPDDSHEAERLMRNAAGLVEGKQYADAIDIYQRVIDKFGETVAQLPKDDPALADRDSALYVDARRYCQLRIAALPPEARALYRRRVDPQAESWFRAGSERGDRAALRRILDQAFCSSFGDDAADLLGDTAFREGRFADALDAYRQVLADPAAAEGALVHPDPDVDLARIAAKKLLCRAASGENAPSPADIEAFAKAYPNAAGEFAGRTGSLAVNVAEAVKSDHLAPPARLDGRWLTFGGGPNRSRVVPGAIDVGSFQWKIRLEPPRVQRTAQPFFMGVNRFNTTPSVPAEKPLSYYPIVVGDQVVYCDSYRVVAYNLGDRNGGDGAADLPTPKVAWEQTVSQFEQLSATGAPTPPRYTLTAHGDRIYARLGAHDPRLGSTLVAIRNNRDVEGKLIWRSRPSDITLPNRRPVSSFRLAYEGSPVADDRNVYIGLTDMGNMTTLYVACLDADTGVPKWVRYLGESPTAGENMGGFSSGGEAGTRLLSLEGSTLYYQTNLGVLAALDAETGGVRWLAAYPRVDRVPGMTSGRDLNPAVVADGLVIVAPDDSQSIFAFHASTGRLAWKSDPFTQNVKLQHVLGVAKGRLFVTGDHVWTLDAKTGKIVRFWPDAGAGFEPAGRGLLAGDQVYWPTKNEIHVLDQATGARSDRGSIPLRQAFGSGGGNLAVGDGYLVVAGVDSLSVFCQNRRLIERYRQEIARSPDDAAAYYRLARVAEATDQEVLALENFDIAVAKAHPSETVDGRPLVSAAKARRYRLLMKIGNDACAAKNWPDAVARFTQASASAESDRDRLSARLQLARAQDSSGDPSSAVATLQGLLAEERLRSLTVPLDLRLTVRADILVADRLDAIVRERGREVYAEYDRQAAALLERGRSERDPRPLEDIERAFPVARALPEALLTIGEIQEKDRPDRAARAYKRLLAASAADEQHARAWLGLARAYEARKLWVPARDAYVQAQNHFAAVKLAGGETVGRTAAERLAKAPFDRMTSDRAEPPITAPLHKLWAVRWPAPSRPLAAAGVPPTPELGRIFLLEGRTLRPIDPSTGGYPWAAELDAEPTWVGYLADRVVVATATRVIALDVADGAPSWKFEAGDAKNSRRSVNPFVRAGDGSSAPADPNAGKIPAVRAVGGRIYALRGSRELVALDGETGQVEWSYSAGAEAINPLWLVTPQRVVLQTRKPNAIVVLDAEDGRRRGEFPGSDDEPAWTREPLPLDDDHVALAVDDRTVAMLDLQTGTRGWTFREPAALPRSGPPRLLGDAGRLFVLRDGSELLRLNPKTGKRLWSVILGLDDLSDRPESLALDVDRLYAANGGILTAYNAVDGSVAWRKTLVGPPSGWSLALGDRHIVAVPDPDRSLEGALDDPSITVRRRDTGAPVQRILLPAHASDLIVRLAPGLALVASQEAGWAYGAPSVDSPRPDR